MIKSFQDLEVYNESYDLAILINRSLNKLPLFEKSDLTSQLRRASKSIPANIAEGYAKRVSEKEFLKHLTIALGSANEMEVHIRIAKDLAYWQKEFSEDMLRRYQILG